MTISPQGGRTSANGWGKYWHLFLLGGAVLILACCYLPAYCLDGLNSDMVIPAIFYWDVSNGGHTADWYWGGASFLFPDLAANFVLHAILGDGVRALEIVSALFFLGWIFALVVGYWKCDLPHVDVFAALVILLAIGIMRLSLPSFFHSVEHGGAYLVTLIALTILQRAWRQGWRGPWSLIVVAVLIFLTSASDSLVLIVLVGPAVATLLFGAWCFPEHRARGIYLALAVGIAGVLGIVISGAIFPPELATGRYANIDRSLVINSLRALRVGFDFKHNRVIAFLSTTDVITLVGTAGYLLGQWRAAASTNEPPNRFFILTYSFFLIACNWGVAILSGNYLGLDSTRYLILALIWPMLLLAGWLSVTVPWRPWMVRLLAVGVAARCVVLALHPPVPQFYLTQKSIMEPGLAALMKQENSPIALGDYWSANMMTVVSNGAVRVLPFSKHGQASHWFVNRRWFELEPEGGFRLILMQNEEPDFIRAHFGDPGRVEKIGNAEVWIYRSEDALHFIPNFGTIGNRQTFPDANTFQIQAAGLFHSTGKLEGDAIVARSDRDLDGTLAGGPDTLVRPGRYRAEYTYAFLVPPEKGREPVFGSDVLVLGTPKFLGSQPLRDVGPGSQKAVEEFSISPSERGLLQCHVDYLGSGTIQIEQQQITRIGD